MKDSVEKAGSERRKIKKRESILSGAIKAFEREGFDGASMDLVAEISGASKRTVYNYFESKEALLWAVIEELMAGQQQLKQIEYSSEASLESQLASFIDAELYFVTDSTRVSMARILTSIFVRSPELCLQASNDNTCQNEQFTAWLLAASEDHRLKVKDPELATQVFYGLTQGLFNFPALYRPLQTATELKPIKDEVIAVFLSRYGCEKGSP